MGVAIHYYRIKWYPGAVGRLIPLLKDDPDYTRRDEAYYYLGETYIKIDRRAEALPYFERLVKEFEKSEYLEKAQRRVTELKSTVPAAAVKDGKG